jgi:hypothetical protein
VVDDQVDDDANPVQARLVAERHEVAEIAEPAIDTIEIRDVVAVVAVRRGIERQQPDAGDAEASEIVQPARQPDEVADTVAVPILKGLDVDAVDDRVLVPEVFDH